jgi:hypothetical protein
MIESTQPQKVARCMGIPAQPATFDDSSAANSATENATSSLKALAGAVLERNTQRNANATHSEKQRNFCNEKTPEKLRSVAADLPPEAEGKTSETEHNAEGRFFKWQITLSDGRGFMAAAMPRRTLLETREQYPDAAAIEPVTDEVYPDD